jgi:hypothetical protein
VGMGEEVGDELLIGGLVKVFQKLHPAHGLQGE